jgi:hypothetical protein
VGSQPRVESRIRADLVERLRAAGVDGFDLWELNAPIVL